MFFNLLELSSKPRYQPGVIFMENQKSPFDTTLDTTAKTHLADAAKWARVFAIAWILLWVLTIVITVVVRLNTGNSPDADHEFLWDIGITAFLFILSFLPSFYLLRFSNRIKLAIAADDIQSLTEGLKSLKVTFRYSGVIVILLLVLLLIFLLSEVIVLLEKLAI